MKSSIIPLQHNAKLYVCTNKQVKGIFVDINFNAGSINDPKGKQGLAHFCEHAICSFPTKRFATRLEKRKYKSSHFNSNAYTSCFNMNFNLQATRDNFEEYFEYICHNFDQLIVTKEEVEQEKNIVGTEIKRRVKTNKLQSFIIRDKKVYDCKQLKNSFGLPDGIYEDVLTITPKDVEGFIKTYITKQNLSSIVITGNITAREAKKLVYKYLYPHLNDGETVGFSENIISKFSKSQVIYEKSIEKENALIKIYFPKILMQKPNIKLWREILIANTYMSNKVFNIIRENQGLSYSCNMDYMLNTNKLSYFSLNIECLESNLAKVISALPDCIHKIKSEFTEEEFELYKNKRLLLFNNDITPMRDLKQALPETYDLFGMTYNQKYLQKVWNATKNAKYEDVKKIVDHFSDEKPIVVIISDQKPQFDLKNFIKQIK